MLQIMLVRHKVGVGASMGLLSYGFSLMIFL